MQFEVEIHKKRIQELTDHKEKLEASIEKYIEQQSLFKLMRYDLNKYKDAADLSIKYETMYSPFTPKELYSQTNQKDLQVDAGQKNEIINLKQLMSATHDGIEKVNKELQEKIKENIKLEEEKKELEI